jgi:hypothetical protein
MQGRLAEHVRLMSDPRMSKRPRDHPTTEAVCYPRRSPLYREEERFITARRYSGSETVLGSTDALTAKRGAGGLPV